MQRSQRKRSSDQVTQGKEQSLHEDAAMRRHSKFARSEYKASRLGMAPHAEWGILVFVTSRSNLAAFDFVVSFATGMNRRIIREPTASG